MLQNCEICIDTYFQIQYNASTWKAKCTMICSWEEQGMQYFGKRRVPYAVDTGDCSEGGQPDEIVGKAQVRSGFAECDGCGCRVISVLRNL